MRLDRPREQIEQDLLVQAHAAWGPERVEALRRQIGEAAGWISRIGQYRLEIYDDEPEFLVAPDRGREGR